MTHALRDRLNRRFGSPFRTHPAQVAQWMQAEGRTPTPAEVASRFGWSLWHACQVLSRMDLTWR